MRSILAPDHATLSVTGEENITVYQAKVADSGSGLTKKSPLRRRFCKICGSALWLWDPRWPELVHPVASAIDTALPVPPEHVHLMTASKAPWVEVEAGDNDRVFEHYPDESIAEWHRRLGLEKPD